jgi:hypothetical protein
MGIPFTEGMGFLLTTTMGFLFTMTLGIQLTISTPGRVRPVLRHESAQQGHRTGPLGGVAREQGPEEKPVPVAEKPREPDAEAGSPAPGAEEPGPKDGAGLPDQAVLGALLGDRRSYGSNILPEALVLLGHPQPAEAGDLRGPDDQGLLARDHQLARRPGDERDDRGLEL